MDDKAGKEKASNNRGTHLHSRGELGQAIECHEKDLEIAVEIGDRAGEGEVYGNLGCAFDSMGDFPKAIEYHEKYLKIAIQIGDLEGKGRASGGLGNAYDSIGDFRKAIKYHENALKIAKEIGDEEGEGVAYGNLGNAYQSLGHYQKAIEYHEKHLKIAMEIGLLGGEGTACGNIGNAYHALAEFQKAIEYHQRALKTAIEIADREGEGFAYGNLGNAYNSLGDFLKALDYYEKHLKIAIEIGDRAGEGRAYGNLGTALQSLGEYEKAIKYHEKDLKIAKEIGDRAGEGTAYGNLGTAYQSLGDNLKAIEHNEKHLKIAIEIGDRAGEGRGYGNLGIVYWSLDDCQKATEYHEMHLKIAIEIGDRAGEGTAYGNLGNAFQSLGDYQKAIEYHEKHLKIAIAIGDRGGEARAYHNIGNSYFSIEQFEDAVSNFVSAVDVFNSLRSLLKSEDVWKINFRQQHEETYAALWKSLLMVGKIEEALFAAEQGLAQTLSDNLLIQYKVAPRPSSAAKFDSKKTISLLLTELSTPIIFLTIEGLTINIWFMRREKKIAFRQGRLEADRREKYPIRTLRKTAFQEVYARREDPAFMVDNPLTTFYDAVIGPIVDLLGPEDNELVIISDGELCLTPWTAVINWIRIRTVPSLTSYQLITSVPEGYHKKKGALLVGNPCLNELEKPFSDLLCAQKEIEMIASIFNTRPLTGREATKAEVMRRMSSVGVIHIAGFADKYTGGIVLSPNPGWTSRFPMEKDYILKMSDVQATNLRARLVVLSCGSSGQGRILKGEGLVGIARAFLAAGARSVLVTLWAIDDEATMMFMKSFYQHLKEGNTASGALHQSIKSFRESKEYSEMRYWAPFQLIGDDVKIEFEVIDDVDK